eukprot:CAMPEP_0174701848 /NCGR_PEP_ID=MMETSP1094-20130205/6347_1 /TAXON_ID=156173 /ORGANISM="Chrysochromulina brevifilum, Strain UTEX LB 985" /LENGTH=72 /DNA_ID=CAMNT_0015899553 /DNA_START=456 /DNA_END=675 /DNA_ORIENTATION=-
MACAITASFIAAASSLHARTVDLVVAVPHTTSEGEGEDGGEDEDVDMPLDVSGYEANGRLRRAHVTGLLIST